MCTFATRGKVVASVLGPASYIAAMTAIERSLDTVPVR